MSNHKSLAGYLERQKQFYLDHVAYHPERAFCGSAGKEEMLHVEKLVESLSDEQLQKLIKKCGIGFSGTTFDRDVYEDVIDEIDREDFYRSYREILSIPEE